MIYNLIMNAPAAGQAGGSMMGSFVMMLLIFVLFWFLLIRPQSQRYKKHQAMLSAIVKGDKVVTNGGIVGKVIKAKDDELTIEIAANTRVQVVRAMIADVLNKPAAANDSGKK